MIISEKQILQLFTILAMRLTDFEKNIEYRMRLYNEIINQQSDKLEVIDDNQ